MTEFIFPPMIGLAAIGIGLGVSLHSQAKQPGPLPVLVRISQPIGTPPSDAVGLAHPVMPTIQPTRAVRVVLSSPFVGRGSR